MYRTKVYAFQLFKSISPFTELRPFWTIFIFSWSIFWKLLFESYAWKRTIIWMQNGYTFFLPCTIPYKDLSFLRFFPVKVTLKQPQKQNETSAFCMMWLSLHFFIHAQQFWVYFCIFSCTRKQRRQTARQSIIIKCLLINSVKQYQLAAFYAALSILNLLVHHTIQEKGQNEWRWILMENLGLLKEGNNHWKMSKKATLWTEDDSI